MLQKSETEMSRNWRPYVMDRARLLPKVANPRHVDGKADDTDNECENTNRVEGAVDRRTSVDSGTCSKECDP